MLDILPVEAGAFYVMDRGYVDFARLYALHQAGAFFVTRVKAGMDARRVYSAATDRTTVSARQRHLEGIGAVLDDGVHQAHRWTPWTPNQ
ncbi:MAG: hypothetical protein JSS17_13675 [Proteobacteria bacterium]|nr:hypothetical protein [Pseudomonadota bacterium]